MRDPSQKIDSAYLAIRSQVNPEGWGRALGGSTTPGRLGCVPRTRQPIRAENHETPAEIHARGGSLGLVLFLCLYASGKGTSLAQTALTKAVISWTLTSRFSPKKSSKNSWKSRGEIAWMKG
jgi:hypothetical protein